jgi:superfamily II DNA or RNA helicase
MIDSYVDFIARKSAVPRFGGLTVDDADFSGSEKPHQRDLIKWALAKGRAAIFADTGLGKTLMELTWARRVSREGRVLILAPLAVAEQTVREGDRWGIQCRYMRADDGNTPIVIANYEMLEHFDAEAFAGVVLDESSILKAFNGKTRNAIIGAFSGTPYRLAATATPAPNDFTELGNHSEFLGVRSRVEMLAEYFVHDGGSTQDWRLKGHAVSAFWRWVASWGAVVRRPSDLGHDGAEYALPPLRMHEHVIPVDARDAWESGMLFPDAARTLQEQRAVRRSTTSKRVDKAVDLVDGDAPSIVWCELNDEGDSLERAIPGAIQVKGADSPERKAQALDDFANGRIRVLVTKPSIAGFGLNWQHASRMVFVGASHSYEQTYQAIRRCWRFGQTKPVDVHVIRAETESAIVENYRRKESDAARMGEEMALHVIDSVRAEVLGASSREWNPYGPDKNMIVPTWIGEETV